MAPNRGDLETPQRRAFLKQAAAAAAAVAFGQAALADDKKGADEKKGADDKAPPAEEKKPAETKPAEEKKTVEPKPVEEKKPAEEKKSDEEKKGSEEKKKPSPAESPMPTIQFGKHRISRLIAGWNPIGGLSQPTLDMAKAMREYFSLENTIEFLQSCEKNAISAWQFEHTQKAVETIQTLRKSGSKLKGICLHAERSVDAPIKTVIDETSPIAIAHHGIVTDSLFRANKADDVQDFVKKVHDAGLLAGVASHCPDNIKRIADEGWEVDFFMCSFYYVNRPVEDQQKLCGKIAVGEPFFESDPSEMCKVMRAVAKPCLAFKILAAGRVCWSKRNTEQAFKFAFGNVKPADGMIVGMFPRYNDQVAEDCALVRKHGVVPAA